MKRRILSILLLFTVSISFLSGCDNTLANDSISENELEENSVKHSSSSDLKVVTNGSNRGMLLYSTGTETGYYESIAWTEEMYSESSMWMHISNLTYTDYATKTRIYLCGTPGCAHNNENCTSYIRYSRGIVLFTDSLQTELFCMATGAMNGEVYSDDDLGRIYRMNLDGSNRKELIRLNANESFSLEDPVLSDNGNLYVCVVVTKDAKTEPKKELRKINLDTGKITVLRELTWTEWIVSVYDDVIIILIENSSGEANLEYYGYSVSKNTEETLYILDVDINEPYFVMCADSFLFIPSIVKGTDNGTLRIVDIKTGDETSVSGIPQEAIGAVAVYNYFDGKLHWSYVDKSEIGIAHEYIVDCGTGEFWEKTLTFNDSNSISQMVQILAEFDDSFLVLMETENSTLTLTDREGIPHVYDFPDRPVCAVISKDDYWNNNPKYSLIDDQV